MVKRFLEEKSPESEVRRLMATSEGYDSAVWTRWPRNWRWQGLGSSQEYRWSGYGPVELYVVFEEMGAATLLLAVLLERRPRRERRALRG